MDTLPIGVGSRPARRITALSALRASASTWFVIAALGHWIFLAYVLAAFGLTALNGDIEAWNARLTQGYVAGDFVGNAAVAAHLLFAVVVLGAGPLQLIPALRRRFPVFHRWTGRAYLVGVTAATLAGLYMLFDRDIGSWSLKTGFVLQAGLIAVFGVLAFRHALARRIQIHRRWALRFFMVSSIALTYRVIFMIWMLVTGGIGIDMETGEGAFLDAMALGQFLPLLILEIYLWTLDRGNSLARSALAGVLFASAAATALGIAMLSAGLWFA